MIEDAVKEANDIEADRTSELAEAMREEATCASDESDHEITADDCIVGRELIIGADGKALLKTASDDGASAIELIADDTSFRDESDGTILLDARIASLLDDAERLLRRSEMATLESGNTSLLAEAGVELIEINLDSLLVEDSNETMDDTSKEETATRLGCDGIATSFDDGSNGPEDIS